MFLHPNLDERTLFVHACRDNPTLLEIELTSLDVHDAQLIRDFVKNAEISKSLSDEKIDNKQYLSLDSQDWINYVVIDKILSFLKKPKDCCTNFEFDNSPSSSIERNNFTVPSSSSSSCSSSSSSSCQEPVTDTEDPTHYRNFDIQVGDENNIDPRIFFKVDPEEQQQQQQKRKKSCTSVDTVFQQYKSGMINPYYLNKRSTNTPHATTIPAAATVTPSIFESQQQQANSISHIAAAAAAGDSTSTRHHFSYCPRHYVQSELLLYEQGDSSTSSGSLMITKETDVRSNSPIPPPPGFETFLNDFDNNRQQQQQHFTPIECSCCQLELQRYQQQQQHQEQQLQQRQYEQSGRRRRGKRSRIKENLRREVLIRNAINNLLNSYEEDRFSREDQEMATIDWSLIFN